jgi:hypothetical protein
LFLVVFIHNVLPEHWQFTRTRKLLARPELHGIQIGVLHDEAEPDWLACKCIDIGPVSPGGRMINVVADQFLRIVERIAFYGFTAGILDFNTDKARSGGGEVQQKLVARENKVIAPPV